MTKKPLRNKLLLLKLKLKHLRVMQRVHWWRWAAKEVCVVLKASSVSSWRLNRFEVLKTCRSAKKCVCEQQCQWEPGAADVSPSASASHPCPALRGGGRQRTETVKEQWLLLSGLRPLTTSTASITICAAKVASSQRNPLMGWSRLT